MNPSPRLVIIADVGGEQVRHHGDEAILEANLAAFRRRLPGASFVVATRDPAWIERRYGVGAIDLVGFARGPSAAIERRALLDRLMEDAASRRGHATIEAVAGADAVVVSGGGNLAAAWPDLVYERAALLKLARRFDKPTLVLGQTIGPALGPDERQLLAETLPEARHVGVRDLPSAALARRLGVSAARLWYQCDDAMAFGDETLAIAGVDGVACPPIAVTIDPQVRAAARGIFEALATQLRALSTTTGAPLVLIPHAFGDESTEAPSDLTEARLLADRIGLPSTTILAGVAAAEARRITSAAGVVISTRFHALIFALSGATPCIGLYGDDYCRVKLQGALAHAHHDDWAMTYDAVARGEVQRLGLDLWRHRLALRATLEARREEWRDEARERWAVIVQALDQEPSAAPAARDLLFGRPMAQVEPALVAALEAERQARADEQLAAPRREDEHRREDERRSRDVAAISRGGVSRRMARAVLARLRRLTT
jgi:polysaccharide pyruvyl transferase WcaK-like protein